MKNSITIDLHKWFKPKYGLMEIKTASGYGINRRPVDYDVTYVVYRKTLFRTLYFDFYDSQVQKRYNGKIEFHLYRSGYFGTRLSKEVAEHILNELNNHPERFVTDRKF